MRNLKRKSKMKKTERSSLPRRIKDENKTVNNKISNGDYDKDQNGYHK